VDTGDEAVTAVSSSTVVTTSAVIQCDDNMEVVDAML
jgi:hypothetical protein